MNSCYLFNCTNDYLIHEYFLQGFPFVLFLCFCTVAKRKSLFDDKSIEIQELTYIIKQDINSLNKQIGQLQQVSHCKLSIELKSTRCTINLRVENLVHVHAVVL